MIIVAPSCTGEVSITDRERPVLRPVVVSSSTGMFDAFHPARPPLILSTLRWIAFIALNAKSLGMLET
jgi:hypothetical protein